MQRLHLVLRLPGGLAAFAAANHISCNLVAALTAFGTKGGLRELILQTGLMPLSLGSWMAPLGGSLQQLAVSSHGELRVASPLTSLTALQHMELSGNPLVLEGGARLPQAMTSLLLAGDGDANDEDAAMPEKVGWRRALALWFVLF